MLREFIKGVIIIVILGAFIVSAFVWYFDGPDPQIWVLRIGCPVVAFGAFALFLKVHFRRSEVPDYLYKSFGGFFDRGGFCFTFTTRCVDGLCFLEAYYQNKYERPCIGRIALRPAKGLFGRKKIDAITFEVECDAAAFGVARIPIPVPLAFQGKKQKFEVGASVTYPTGKGRMLRFREGLLIRTNSNFGDTFSTTLAVAGALTGNIVLSSPATATIVLPDNVAEETPSDVKPEITTLWKLGDESIAYVP